MSAGQTSLQNLQKSDGLTSVGEVKRLLPLPATNLLHHTSLPVGYVRAAVGILCSICSFFLRKLPRLYLLQTPQTLDLLLVRSVQGAAPCGQLSLWLLEPRLCVLSPWLFLPLFGGSASPGQGCEMGQDAGAHFKKGRLPQFILLFWRTLPRPGHSPLSV